jgi:hypothetical protein
MSGNRHGLTGAPLEQPSPPPLRTFAVFDKTHPCVEHLTGYEGAVPCTGDYRCSLCGTVWDEDGNVLAVGVKRPVRHPAPPPRPATRKAGGRR